MEKIKGFDQFLQKYNILMKDINPFIDCNNFVNPNNSKSYDGRDFE